MSQIASQAEINSIWRAINRLTDQQLEIAKAVADIQGAGIPAARQAHAATAEEVERIIAAALPSLRPTNPTTPQKPPQ